MLALLLLSLQAVRRVVAGTQPATALRTAAVGLIAPSTVALAGLAFSRAYPRLYLPVAYRRVPLLLPAVQVVMLSYGCQPQLLGPLYFLGLPFRAGLLSAALAFLFALGTACALKMPRASAAERSDGGLDSPPVRPWAAAGPGRAGGRAPRNSTERPVWSVGKLPGCGAPVAQLDRAHPS